MIISDLPIKFGSFRYFAYYVYSRFKVGKDTSTIGAFAYKLYKKSFNTSEIPDDLDCSKDNSKFYLFMDWVSNNWNTD